MPADRFTLPFQQVFDATPNVRSGGKLWFYAAGTDTPLNTYSDKNLAVANSNPVILNALGQPDVAIFLSPLAYKVKLLDANDVEIWSADNTYGAQYSTTAQVNSGFGSPNGLVAGTAGSVGVPASVYWDATSNILYICTQTGDAASAVWTAVNAASAANVVTPPQGRLTPTSATPVISSDVSAATAIYYTPYCGNLLPLYSGTAFVSTVFSELGLSLSSSHSANAIYDVFAFNNSGVVTLVTGPAWTTATAGSGARGTGATTTELARINGILVNAVAMTGRNGLTTYSIAANRATLLGSLSIDGSAGQVTCHVSWGQSRKWGISNAYNRVPVVLQGGDSTASWTFSTVSPRQSNNSSANRLTVFNCLPEEPVLATFLQAITQLGVGNTIAILIGWNSTTAGSGTNGGSSLIGGTIGANIIHYTRAEYDAPPFIGIANVQALESGDGSGGMFGGRNQMNLMARWRA